MAITTDQTFEQRMTARMLQEMQKELDQIAEPIIVKALADIQTELHRRMGSIALGLCEASYSVHTDQRTLHIEVRIKEPK